MEKTAGKCLLDNWVEEREVAVVVGDASPEQVQRRGHTGILSMNLESRMEDISTLKSSYPPPGGPGRRERGIRRELLEEMVTQRIRERVHAEFNPVTPATEFISTTQSDFSYRGHLSPPPKPTKNHDYKCDQAVTFWSENRQQIQRTTVVQTADSPFKRIALFSTPITQRLHDQ